MKIAHIDTQNKLLGWYTEEIHTVIPTPNIEVTDEQWQQAIHNGHNKVNEDGSTELFDFRTAEEIAQQIEDNKPKVVTMRQTRLALLQSGLLEIVDMAIADSTDTAMKIEWEYATEVKRDWASLIALTTALGMTSLQLDDLFQLASEL